MKICGIIVVTLLFGFVVSCSEKKTIRVLGGREDVEFQVEVVLEAQKPRRTFIGFSFDTNRRLQTKIIEPPLDLADLPHDALLIVDRSSIYFEALVDSEFQLVVPESLDFATVASMVAKLVAGGRAVYVVPNDAE